MVERFRKLIRLEPEGRYRVDMSYFDYDAHAMLQPFKPKFIDTFGPPRRPGEPLEHRHLDIAFALQAVTEEAVLHIARASGAHLSLAQSRDHRRRRAQLRRQRPGRARHRLPQRLGAARRLRHRRAARLGAVALPSDAGPPARLRARPRFVRPRVRPGRDRGRTSRAKGLRLRAAAGRRACSDGSRRISPPARIVGWFQGRFEMGPRALGNRSLLADPRRAEMKDILNARIKSREPFRPFAPAVLAEEASRFFELDGPDPFMTKAPRVRPEMRDVIPAAVHVDGTARVQTDRAAGQPALLRPDQGVRRADRRAGADQHQLQRARADRRAAGGGDRLLPAHRPRRAGARRFLLRRPRPRCALARQRRRYTAGAVGRPGRSRAQPWHEPPRRAAESCAPPSAGSSASRLRPAWRCS